MRINFFIIFLFFLSILSFLLIYHRLDNSLSINKPSFFYFLIPVTFFILSIVSLFLSKKNLFFLSYTLIVITFISYSVEGFLKFIIYPDINKVRKTYFEKNNYDIRNKFEIFDEIEKKLDKTISVPPQIFLSKDDKKILPLSGLSNKMTIICNESGYFSSYFSDRYGFNNNNKIYDEDEIFSIFIGDSFTNGYCVNTQNNLISNLQSKNFFKEKNILNLGYGGNGPLLSYATLREYLNKNKNTKYVFWLYYEPNDLIELSKEIKDSILKKYLKNLSFSQNLILKQKEVDFIINEKIQNEKIQFNQNKIVSTNKLTAFLSLDETRRYIFKLTNSPIKKNKEIIDLFSIIVKNLKNFSNKENFELIFIYLPGKKLNEGSLYYKDIISLINKEKVKLIDLSSSNFYKKNIFYPKYGEHFNQKGYEELSIKIHNELSQM
jgi:hypothetical protein